MSRARPRRGRSPPGLRVLRKSDLERLEKWRGLGGFIIVYYLDRSPKPTPVILEKVFRLWLADRRDKVRNADFACAFGTLLGDLLVGKYDFRWRKRIDEQGESFALGSESTGWETYPIDYVWKRVDPKVLGEEIGFLQHGVSWWRGKVPVRKAAREATRRPARRK